MKWPLGLLYPPSNVHIVYGCPHSDHHVLWLHHSIPENQKLQILRMKLQTPKEILEHFHDLALHYRIKPLALNGNELVIKNRTYRVFEDNSVRTSMDEKPLSDDMLKEMIKTL